MEREWNRKGAERRQEMKRPERREDLEGKGGKVITDNGYVSPANCTSRQRCADTYPRIFCGYLQFSRIRIGYGYSPGAKARFWAIPCTES